MDCPNWYDLLSKKAYQLGRISGFLAVFFRKFDTKSQNLSIRGVLIRQLLIRAWVLYYITKLNNIKIRISNGLL